MIVRSPGVIAGDRGLGGGRWTKWTRKRREAKSTKSFWSTPAAERGGKTCAGPSLASALTTATQPLHVDREPHTQTSQLPGCALSSTDCHSRTQGVWSAGHQHRTFAPSVMPRYVALREATQQPLRSPFCGTGTSPATSAQCRQVDSSSGDVKEEWWGLKLAGQKHCSLVAERLRSVHTPRLWPVPLGAR